MFEEFEYICQFYDRYISNSNNAGKFQNQPQEMSGFSDKVFEEAVAAQFKCPVCTFVLKDPVQAPCGHLFCLSCIQKAIR